MPVPLTVTLNSFVKVAKSDTFSTYPFNSLSFALKVAVRVTSLSSCCGVTTPSFASIREPQPVSLKLITLSSEDVHVILDHAVFTLLLMHCGSCHLCIKVVTIPADGCSALSCFCLCTILLEYKNKVYIFGIDCCK